MIAGARPGGRDRASDRHANSETGVTINTKIISSKSVVHPLRSIEQRFDYGISW